MFFLLHLAWTLTLSHQTFANFREYSVLSESRYKPKQSRFCESPGCCFFKSRMMFIRKLFPKTSLPPDAGFPIFRFSVWNMDSEDRGLKKITLDL